MPENRIPPESISGEPMHDEDPRLRGWEAQGVGYVTGKFNAYRERQGLEPVDHAPWWARLAYGALERWGVPTLMLAVTVGAFAYYFHVNRQDRKEERAEFIAAIERNTKAVEAVTSQMSRNGETLQRLDHRTRK